jgi:hypothetical protein
MLKGVKPAVCYGNFFAKDACCKVCVINERCKHSTEYFEERDNLALENLDLSKIREKSIDIIDYILSRLTKGLGKYKLQKIKPESGEHVDVYSYSKDGKSVYIAHSSIEIIVCLEDLKWKYNLDDKCEKADDMLDDILLSLLGESKKLETLDQEFEEEFEEDEFEDGDEDSEFEDD